MNATLLGTVEVSNVYGGFVLRSVMVPLKEARSIIISEKLRDDISIGEFVACESDNVLLDGVVLFVGSGAGVKKFTRSLALIPGPAPQSLGGPVDNKIIHVWERVE